MRRRLLGEKKKRGKMKRRILAILMSVGIGVTGLSVNALAAEADPQALEAVEEMYVDLSDVVIQEGGFLPQEEARAGADSEVESGLKEQVQKDLMAAWDAFSKTCDMSAYKLTSDEMSQIYFGTLNKNPRYFYVQSSYSYSLTSAGLVTDIDISYKEPDESARAKRDAYDRAVAAVVNGAQASWSDMEKALYINDYLARNCQYDTSLTKRNAYEALVNGSAVCQGYALAFMDLAQELGLVCETVTSGAINHAWNMVNVGGSYYNVDVTWNDPLQDRLGRVRHLYFMKSTAYFKQGSASSQNFNSHLGSKDDWVVSGGVQAAAASDFRYDNYFWNQSDTGFDCVDGYWYGFNGSDSICRYDCNGTDFIFSETVKNIPDIWMQVGSGSSYWPGKFVGTGNFNGKYYYSGSDAIYELDVATKESAPVYTLTQAERSRGYIYGMNISAAGEIQYLLAGGPNVSGEILTASKLEPPHVHTIVTDEAVPATCTEAGRTEGRHCSQCGEVLQKPEIIPALGHEWDSDYTVDKEPTMEKEGEKSIHCSRCEARKNERPIPRLEAEEIDLSDCEIRLSQYTYIYNGKAKKPAVTVRFGDDVLTPSEDYQVEYSDNIHAGEASAIISGKGIYVGSLIEDFQIEKASNQIIAAEKYTKISKAAAQTFKLNVRAKGGTIAYQSLNKNVKASRDGKVTIAGNFVGKALIKVTAESEDYARAWKNITITVNPAAVSLTQARNISGRKLELKWKKNAKVTGYQVQYSDKIKFTGAKSKWISGSSKTKCNLTSLKKKTYYVRIRTYKTVYGIKYYSAWSGAKKVVVKK